jgi:integrase
MTTAKSGSIAAAKRRTAWIFRVGEKPNTVVAYERGDKGNTVWVRWARKGTGVPDKMSTRLRLRDELGRLLPERLREAEQAAKDVYLAIIEGRDPRLPKPKTDADGKVALTIAAGFRLAMNVPEGMYPVVNEHVKDMQRYQRRLLLVLEPGLTWDELTSVSYEQAWRKLAELKRNQGVGGLRSCELAIVLLAQAGRWLERAGKLKEAPAVPASQYVTSLRNDWQRITKESVVKNDPPRHTPHEVGRLFLNIDNPDVDPRIRLAFRTAGEARLGQALRCNRDALDLSAIGSYRVGRFIIPDNGKKKGAVIDLTPALREAWDYELSRGYLKDLETAFQAKRRKSYPLFPGKRLVRGAARADSTEPIGKRGALDLWHRFEIAAGVPVVEGRGWYGVRRTGADLAEDVESDGRALNAITGHQSDEMRRRIYQQKQRDAVLAKAMRAREAARQIAIDVALATEEESSTATDSSRWEQSREAKRQRRRVGGERVSERRQASYPPKPCTKCGSEFIPAGPNSKACMTCSPRRVRPSNKKPEAP